MFISSLRPRMCASAALLEWRHFKTLSLDELRSPDLNLLSDQEYSEEEEAEAITETMEQYMSKTRTDYGSGVARPKIDNKDQFELKGQFLKELLKTRLAVRIMRMQMNTILDSRGAIPTMTAADAKTAIQEMAKYSQKWHNGTSRGRSTKTSNGLAAIQAQLNNLGREIKKVNGKVYAAQVGCVLDNHYYEEEERIYEPKFIEAYGASHINYTIPRKEKDRGSFTLPCFINNVCFNNALVDLGASVSVMPLLTYLNLGLGELAHTRLTVELANRTMKYPKVNNLKNILSRKLKDYFRVSEEKIIFKSVKPASSLIRRVYMLSLRERMELDLDARLMGETLVLNRSLDHFLEDYIELNDLNEPIKLKRNQGDDLMPTIEEGVE
ncbi:gag-pol polyprotein [Tanacetum coccineum]